MRWRTFLFFCSAFVLWSEHLRLATLLFFLFPINFAVFCAIETRDVVEVNKILRGHDHAVRETRGFEKRTALHHAAEHGNLQICQILLNYGADVNKKDAREYTPLWLAARKGNIDICHLLINEGAGTYFLDQWQLETVSIPNEIKNMLHCWKDSRGTKSCFLHISYLWVFFIYIIYFLLIQSPINTCSSISNTAYYYSDYENSKVIATFFKHKYNPLQCLMTLE